MLITSNLSPRARARRGATRARSLSRVRANTTMVFGEASPSPRRHATHDVSPAVVLPSRWENDTVVVAKVKGSRPWPAVVGGYPKDPTAKSAKKVRVRFLDDDRRVMDVPFGGLQLWAQANWEPSGDRRAVQACELANRLHNLPDMPDRKWAVSIILKATADSKFGLQLTDDEREHLARIEAAEATRREQDVAMQALSPAPVLTLAQSPAP